MSTADVQINFTRMLSIILIMSVLGKFWAPLIKKPCPGLSSFLRSAKTRITKFQFDHNSGYARMKTS